MTDSTTKAQEAATRVVNAYSARFFHGVSEGMHAAFAEAELAVSRTFDEPERANMLGQARHALCEKHFRDAALNVGLRAHPLHTVPAGGRFSLVEGDAGKVLLVRCNVQTHCGPPRATRFREERAALNAWLEPSQLDLWGRTPVPSTDFLCAMLVVTAFRRHHAQYDQSIPAFIGLGVPRSDLSDWLFLWPLNQLIGMCRSEETKRRRQAQPPAEAVQDLAKPVLRKPVLKKPVLKK